MHSGFADHKGHRYLASPRASRHCYQSTGRYRLIDGVSVARTKRPVRSSRDGGLREQFCRSRQISPERGCTPLWTTFPHLAEFAARFAHAAVSSRPSTPEEDRRPYRDGRALTREEHCDLALARPMPTCGGVLSWASGWTRCPRAHTGRGAGPELGLLAATPRSRLRGCLMIVASAAGSAGEDSRGPSSALANHRERRVWQPRSEVQDKRAIAVSPHRDDPGPRRLTKH